MKPTAGRQRRAAALLRMAPIPCERWSQRDTRSKFQAPNQHKSRWMWKPIIRWSLYVATAAFASGLVVQIARPPVPEGVLAGLRLTVGAAVLLALLGTFVYRFFPPRAGPLVIDSRFWLRAVLVIGAMNFLLFVLVASAIGGDALNGYAEHGRYFLRNHGVVTEVSRPVFTYSRWHAISTFMTHPMAILAAWMLQRDKAQDVN